MADKRARVRPPLTLAVVFRMPACDCHDMLPALMAILVVDLCGPAENLRVPGEGSTLARGQWLKMLVPLKAFACLD